jgi:hypothetical protein
MTKRRGDSLFNGGTAKEAPIHDLLRIVPDVESDGEESSGGIISGSDVEPDGEESSGGIISGSKKPRIVPDVEPDGEESSGGIISFDDQNGQRLTTQTPQNYSDPLPHYPIGNISASSSALLGNHDDLVVRFGIKSISPEESGTGGEETNFFVVDDKRKRDTSKRKRDVADAVDDKNTVRRKRQKTTSPFQIIIDDLNGLADSLPNMKKTIELFTKWLRKIPIPKDKILLLSKNITYLKPFLEILDKAGITRFDQVNSVMSCLLSADHLQELFKPDSKAAAIIKACTDIKPEILPSITSMQHKRGMMTSEEDFRTLIEFCGGEVNSVVNDGNQELKITGEIDRKLLTLIASIQNAKGFLKKQDLESFRELITLCSGSINSDDKTVPGKEGDKNLFLKIIINAYRLKGFTEEDLEKFKKLIKLCGAEVSADHKIKYPDKESRALLASVISIKDGDKVIRDISIEDIKTRITLFGGLIEEEVIKFEERITLELLTKVFSLSRKDKLEINKILNDGIKQTSSDSPPATVKRDVARFSGVSYALNRGKKRNKTQTSIGDSTTKTDAQESTDQIIDYINSLNADDLPPNIEEIKDFIKLLKQSKISLLSGNKLLLKSFLATIAEAGITTEKQFISVMSLIKSGTHLRKFVGSRNKASSAIIKACIDAGILL